MQTDGFALGVIVVRVAEDKVCCFHTLFKSTFCLSGPSGGKLVQPCAKNKPQGARRRRGSWSWLVRANSFFLYFVVGSSSILCIASHRFVCTYLYSTMYRVLENHVWPREPQSQCVYWWTTPHEKTATLIISSWQQEHNVSKRSNTMIEG